MSYFSHLIQNLKKIITTGYLFQKIKFGKNIEKIYPVLAKLDIQCLIENGLIKLKRLNIF